MGVALRQRWFSTPCNRGMGESQRFRSRAERHSRGGIEERGDPSDWMTDGRQGTGHQTCGHLDCRVSQSGGQTRQHVRADRSGQTRAARPVSTVTRGESIIMANEDVKIMTVASCSNIRAEHHAHVVVSGSYGGRYNAYNAAKWPVRAVIMNDAGIGKDNAGIVGLEFLDQINMAAATADARSCHIGDGDHMLSRTALSATSIARPPPWAARRARAFGTAPRACGQRRCRRSRHRPSPRAPGSSCATFLASRR